MTREAEDEAQDETRTEVAQYPLTVFVEADGSVRINDHFSLLENPLLIRALALSKDGQRLNHAFAFDVAEELTREEISIFTRFAELVGKYKELQPQEAIDELYPE
jgi:hypothetical protein